MVLTSSNDESTTAVWPHAFMIRFIVVVSGVLDMTLEVRNLSHGSFDFEEATAYVSVRGDRAADFDRRAGGSDYIDEADGEKRKKQGERGDPDRGETDRVYYSSRRLASDGC